MRCATIIACILWVTMVGIMPGFAEKRVALVIGNSNYQHVGRLSNPVNDGAAIAILLRSAGFAVVEPRSDIDLVQMRRAISDFAETLRDSDIAVIYFAGHGIEVDGTNYLIPFDAVLARDFDVEDETISLDCVLRAIEPARRLRLVILDSCHPFTESIKRSTRAIGGGLARVEPATPNALIAFAAKVGSTANDGNGEHSPFAAALLKHLDAPGLDVRLAPGEVRDAVMASTSPRQEPFVYDSLGGRTISIVDAPASSSASPATSVADPAAQAWAAVKDANSIAALEAFIRRFSDSFYADWPRLRIDELKKQQTAEIVPPMPPVVGPLVVPPAAAGPCGGVSTVPLSSRGAAPLSAAEECALKPKDSFRECANCPELVVVPAASFTMGSPESEKDRRNDEGPQHRVTIGKPFAVGKFHVTVDQFAAFVAETGYDAGSKCRTFEDGKVEERSGRSWRNPGFAQSGSHPAVCLSLNDAKAYMDWLARKTGKTYRLLTEAEWEYAARARIEPAAYSRYSFGDDENDLCRYGNGADRPRERRSRGRHPAGWQLIPR